MEIREIFLEAAKLMEFRHSKWMCICVKFALCPNKKPYNVEIPENFADCGFNRENYTKFIKNNYPDLEKYILFSFNEYDFPWIDSQKDLPEFELVIKSKIEFLKYLANGQ